MHSDSKRSPGDPLTPVPAETWNGMVDAGNAFRASKLSNGTPQPTRPRETDIIRLKNSGSGDRARGEILRIDGKAITDLSDEHIWLIGQEPLGDDFFGILKEPIEDGAVGRVQVSGCCIALVDVIDAGHNRAKSVAGEYVLESSDDGPIEILYAPSGTGELECVVRFGGHAEETGIIIMTPEGGIPQRVGIVVGKANCDVYRINDSDELVATGEVKSIANMTASPVEGGVYGQAKLVSGRWVIDVEECDPDGPSSSV